MSKKNKTRVILLGATGSIGTQSLDILDKHRDEFELVGISAGTSEDKIREIMDRFETIEKAALAQTELESYKGKEILAGEDSMSRLLEQVDYDLLINAVVGFRGLKPTLQALEASKKVGLANKESLVCGGELVKKALQEHEGSIAPIDSEHSAIWQALQGNDTRDIKRLWVTASGGSLRNLSRDELKDVTVERALAHPNWNMGKRITIDSATMVNKAFELTEAHYLFDVPIENVNPVLHPQSLVHSMVEYNDGAIMAQLGSADMHVPIQYALFHPRRPYLEEKAPLDFFKPHTLQFEAMDHERFPMIDLASIIVNEKGNRGTVINAADEMAIELFLDHKIPFTGIEESILKALDYIENTENPDFDQLKEADLKTREYVRSLWTTV